MVVPPIPIQRYLVPDQKPAAAAGFTVVQTSLLTGLPYPIRLNNDIQLIVILPTGLAIAWRDADPSTVVSTSTTELFPKPYAMPQEVGYVSRAPLRIVAQWRGSIVSVVPLVAGLQRVVPDGGNQNLGSQIELAILQWEIRAGTLRGAGDFGSQLTLAWRIANQSSEQYSLDSINTRVISRTEPQTLNPEQPRQSPAPGGLR